MAFAKLVTHLAVAALFLLLSSCRSLHVMEDDHGLQVILATHHKTGTMLVYQATRCFDSSFNYTLDFHWKGDPLGPHEKVLHLIRDPISIALSAYLYHKETGEDWSFRPGGAWLKLGKDKFLRKWIHDRSESYTDFLRRVNVHVGIRAEITHSTAGFLEMENAAKSCGVSRGCMQMCLEEFTMSASSFDASWRKVLNFAGQQGTPEMYKCLARGDLNRNPAKSGRASHITSNSLPAGMYDFLRHVVLELDTFVFHGMLTHMAKGHLHCGASNLLYAQAGPHATNGGEYTAWLIEDEYS